CPAGAALRGEHGLRLGRMGRDEIQERRRQAVVGLQLQLLQSCTDLTHASRWESRLDDRGDERAEPWGLPAALLRQLDMEEVEAEEGVSLVLDASVHVHTATGAGVALDGGLLVHDIELLVVRGQADLVSSGYADQRERRDYGLSGVGA